MQEGELRARLEELRQAGRHAGEGQFTLAASRARELLGRYQLAAPFYYGLLMVAAAVRLGVTELAAELEGWRARWVLSGVSLQPHDLRDLPDLLLSTGGEGCLSMALWVAAHHHKPTLVIESHPPGQRLILSGTQRRLEPAAPGGDFPHIAVEVRYPRTWWQRLLRHEGPAEEAAHPLRMNCRLTRFPFRVDGIKLNSPVDLSRSLAVLLVNDPHPGRLVFPPPGVGVQKLSNDWDCSLALGVSEEAGFVVVVEGVAYPAPGIPGCRVWIWADRLPVDLSRASLVTSPELQTLRDRIQRLSRDLRESLLDNLESLRGDLKARVFRIALGRAREALAGGEERTLDLVDRLASAAHDVPAARKDILGLQIEAGGLAERLGRYERAETFYRGALDQDPEEARPVLYSLLGLLKRRRVPPAELEDLCKKVVSDMHRRMKGLNPVETLASYFHMLGQYAWENDWKEEARSYFRQFADIRRGLGLDYRSALPAGLDLEPREPGPGEESNR
ncbi:MAG: hypothetical protein AB1758_23510 [Candidatus Eremiobacterota bacterium]